MHHPHAAMRRALTVDVRLFGRELVTAGARLGLRTQQECVGGASMIDLQPVVFAAHVPIVRTVGAGDPVALAVQAEPLVAGAFTLKELLSGWEHGAPAAACWAGCEPW